MGNDTGGQGIAVKNLTKSRKRINAFLDSGPARIIHTDERHTSFHGQVHDLADFFCMHFSEASATGRKILGKCKNRTAFHHTVTRNHAVTWNVYLFHAKIRTAVRYEHVNFPERARIKQQIQPLSCGQFAFFPLFGDGFFTTHFQDLFFPLLQILDFVVHNTHFYILSYLILDGLP